MKFNLPRATSDEVYAVRETIDFGDGARLVIVIYPQNKLIPRYMADEAIRKLETREARECL